MCLAKQQQSFPDTKNGQSKHKATRITSRVLICQFIFATLAIAQLCHSYRTLPLSLFDLFGNWANDARHLDRGWRLGGKKIATFLSSIVFEHICKHKFYIPHHVHSLKRNIIRKQFCFSLEIERTRPLIYIRTAGADHG